MNCAQQNWGRPGSVQAGFHRPAVRIDPVDHRIQNHRLAKANWLVVDWLAGDWLAGDWLAAGPPAAIHRGCPPIKRFRIWGNGFGQRPGRRATSFGTKGT